MNVSTTEIIETVTETNLTAVQLHCDKTVEYCAELRQKLPSKIELIKVIRVKNKEHLANINNYADCVDTFLLDAYNPQIFGGTDHSINWENIRDFQF